ncbi:MAG: carbohydrate-binding family 9-like protein [Candidatus Hydrogenedentes bacterium]|nr:carbohydrate-binding family 9-like protein [Candidatus Hydrogenedentota bacterium]
MEYVVKHTATRPELSGCWHGPVWDHAKTLTVERFHPYSSAHRPKTRAKLLYDDSGIFVFFRVEDQYVRCTHTEYQSAVYRDACVECFIQPKPDKGYFNFEINCGGTMLLKYIEDARRGPGGFAKSEDVPWPLAKQVQIYHSLPHIIDPEITHPVDWFIEYAIPRAFFEEYIGPMGELRGQQWRANLYKCAEDNSHPHWATWAPIGEELNFHQPERFGVVRFEATSEVS